MKNVDSPLTIKIFDGVLLEHLRLSPRLGAIGHSCHSQVERDRDGGDLPSTWLWEVQPLPRLRELPKSAVPQLLPWAGMPQPLGSWRPLASGTGHWVEETTRPLSQDPTKINGRCILMHTPGGACHYISCSAGVPTLISDIWFLTKNVRERIYFSTKMEEKGYIF